MDASTSEADRVLTRFTTAVRHVYAPTEFKQALDDYTASMGDGKVLFRWTQN
jgi:hypothetical protein